MTAAFLYKHYDINNELLYVGSTYFPKRRNRQHIKHSEWGNEIFKIKISCFKTKAEALKEEKKIIKQEFPRFNKVSTQAYIEMLKGRPIKSFLSGSK